MKIPLSLIIASVFAAAPAMGAHAIPSSGDYLAFCQETVKVYEGKQADRAASNSCLGFVEGAAGMHAAFRSTDKGTPFYCIPDQGTSSYDIISIWITYLKNNPGKLDTAPVISFVLALHEEYPCQEGETAK